MRTFTLQEFHDNPELQREVRAQVSRERAKAVHEAIGWLWRQALAAAARPKHGSLRHTARWAARLG